MNSIAPEHCKQILTAYGCNYLYPGCNTTNGQPQGICKEDCIFYTMIDECQGALEDLIVVASTAEIDFQTQCNDSTIYKSTDCWSISSEFTFCDCYDLSLHSCIVIKPSHLILLFHSGLYRRRKCHVWSR